MELVYLWVEKYKNIHKQGFNFSPKFNCHYDEDSNELTIDENENSIENFFGENINITAIVGKNGSGKSSVLESLSFLNYKNNDTDFSWFYILLSNGTKYIKKMNMDSIVAKKNDEEINVKSVEKISILSYENIIQNSHIKETKHYNGSSSSPSRLQSNSIYIDGPNQKNEQEFQIIQNLFFLLQKDLNLFDFIDSQIVFDYYMVKVSVKKIHDYIKDCSCLDDNSKVEINQIFNFNQKFIAEKRNTFLNKFYGSIVVVYTSFILSHEFDYADGSISNDETVSAKDYIDKILNIKNIENFTDDILKEIEEISIKVLKLENEMYDEDTFKLLLSTKDSLKNITSNNQEIDLNIHIANSEIKNDTFFSKVGNDETMKWLYFLNIIQKNIYKKIDNEDIIYGYEFMSSGERQYLNFLVNVGYTFYEKRKDDDSGTIMFFDEIELSFHPNWQKRVVSDIFTLYERISRLTNKNPKIHLIFATHSPFLLSDIPKQNIIFLDKDENGHCKVVDGLNEKKQTFGANIHTLLSDSFFMEDGLMGEFVKGKINEIINFHNITKKKRHKKCLQKIYEKREKGFRQTQSIVGDPYLKQVLENHLLEIDKFFDKKVAKEKLKARLKKQLAELDDD